MLHGAGDQSYEGECGELRTPVHSSSALGDAAIMEYAVAEYKRSIFAPPAAAIFDSSKKFKPQQKQVARKHPVITAEDKAKQYKAFLLGVGKKVQIAATEEGRTNKAETVEIYEVFGIFHPTAMTRIFKGIHAHPDAETYDRLKRPFASLVHLSAAHSCGSALDLLVFAAGRARLRRDACSLLVHVAPYVHEFGGAIPDRSFAAHCWRRPLRRHVTISVQSSPFCHARRRRRFGAS